MKTKKMMKHVLGFVLCIALLVPMFGPISVYAAEEDDLYLAHQETEYGKGVTKLSKTESLKYKVTELCLKKGDKVDLCFVNAGAVRLGAKWTSDNTAVAKVDSKGVVTAVSEGVATIKFSYTNIMGIVKYATAKVYVGKDNWTVAIDFMPSMGTKSISSI